MSALMARLSRIRRRWWIGGVALLMVAALGAWQFTGDEDEGGGTTLVSASITSLRSTVTGSGTVQARREEDLGFDSAGEVTAVLVEAGDQVTKGQVIARIDPTALQAEYDAAEARVSAAEATVSESDSSDATRVAANQSSLVAARAELESARSALAGATLEATFGGTVTAVGFVKGDRVGSGSSGSSSAGASGMTAGSTSSTTTASGITVVDTGRYLVAATVAAASIDQVEKGQEVDVTVTGATGTLTGTVTKVGRVATVASSGSAQYDVEVKLSKDAADLYVGSSADIEIVVGDEGEMLTVDSSAVRSDDSGDSYVVLADGSQQAVDVGQVQGQLTEITDGLSEGDQVQVAGQAGGRGGRGGDRELPEGFPAGEMPEGGMPRGDLPQGGFPGGDR